MIFKTRMKKGSSKSITIDKNFDLMDVTPEQIAEAAAKTWVIEMQSQIRRLMEAGETEQEIKLFCEEWGPSYKAPRSVRTFTADTMLAEFAKLSAEDQAKVLAGMVKK